MIIMLLQQRTETCQRGDQRSESRLAEQTLKRNTSTSTPNKLEYWRNVISVKLRIHTPLQRFQARYPKRHRMYDVEWTLPHFCHNTDAACCRNCHESQQMFACPPRTIPLLSSTRAALDCEHVGSICTLYYRNKVQTVWLVLFCIMDYWNLPTCTGRRMRQYTISLLLWAPNAIQYCSTFSQVIPYSVWSTPEKSDGKASDKLSLSSRVNCGVLSCCTIVVSDILAYK